jgi:adenylate cyclase
MIPKLLVRKSDTNDEFEFELRRAETRIGRDAEQNDLVLNDQNISRQHAILRQSEDSFVLVDLKSRNGTMVNGRGITELSLFDRDLIAIGEYVLTFSGPSPTASVQFDNQPLGNTLLLRTPDHIVPRIPRKDAGADPSEVADDIETLKRKAETLTHLYELSRVLTSVFSLTEIFESVSRMLFRLTPSERYIVLLRDSKSGELSPFVTEFREPDSPRSGDRISISRTVLDRVWSERVSLLSLDAQADERLAQAPSIVRQQVRSIMCAPLLGKDRVWGVIYLDCRESLRRFGTDDLNLLNALAVETAMAVDNAMTHEQLLKEALARAAYGRFMPQHVVEEILANPGALSLGGNNQVVTMLFSDVRGFTRMSECLSPEMVVQLLNRYFAEMTPIVFEHQGILDKYMGDGLMALFGVPSHNDDAASRAVSAAISMQRRMLRLNRELKATGLPQIQIGIGVNTGIVTVGYIGSEQRTDYTAIGDAVNLAARLEKLAQGQQILISQNTFEATRNAFQIRSFEDVQVKGKDEPVKVYEVIWKEADSMID